jgi:hypothetical protein
LMAIRPKSGGGGSEPQSKEVASPSCSTNDESALGLILLILTIGIPAILLAAYGLDSLGRAFSVSRLLIPATLGVAGTLAIWARTCRRLTPSFFDTVCGLGLALAVAAYCFWLAWPSLYPIAASVDAVHHFQLVDYIYTYRSLVHDPLASANLGEMTTYPFGATLIVALLAWVFQVPSIAPLYPVAALCLTASGLFAYGTTVTALRHRSNRQIYGLIGAALWLMAYRYTIGEFTSDFFLTQMFGQVWLLALQYWLCRMAASWETKYVIPILSASTALMFSYPTWLPAFWTSLAVAVVVCDTATIRRRIAVSLVAFVPSGAFLALYLKDRWQNGLDIIRHEGAVIRFSPENVGILLLVLAVIGLIVTSVDRSTNRSSLRVIGVMTTALAAQTAATYVGASLHLTSYYSAHKMWYPLILFLSVTSAIGLEEITRLAAKRWFSRWRTVLPIGLLAASAALTGWTVIPNLHPKDPLISPDTYAVAQWARENERGQDLAHLEHSFLTPYWVEIGVMKRPRTSSDTRRLMEAPQDVYDWYSNPRQPDIAITDRLGLLDQSSVRLLYRVGDAAVVERGALNADPTVTVSSPVVIDDQFLITSVVTPPHRITAKADIPIRVTIAVPTSMRKEFLLAAQLIDGLGKIWATTEYKVAVGDDGKPTQKSTLRVADLTLRPTDPIPVGVLTIQVFAFSLPEYQRVSMHDVDSIVDRPLVVGRVVTAPIPAGGSSIPASATKIGVVLGKEIGLDASVQENTALRSGEPLEVTIYWRAVARPSRDYTVFLHLLDSNGRVVAQSDSQPVGGNFPTSFWQDGDVVVDRHTVQMPSDLRPGRYRLVGGMYDLSTMKRLAVEDLSGTPTGDVANLGTLDVH